MATTSDIDVKKVEVALALNEMTRKFARLQAQEAATYTQTSLQRHYDQFRECYLSARKFHAEIVAATPLENRELDNYFIAKTFSVLETTYEEAEIFVSQHIDQLVAMHDRYIEPIACFQHVL